MPVARYFLYVGTVLLALLFIVDACLPKPPVDEATYTPATPVIRISSERKWPERIVFDTTITPMAQTADAANLVGVKPAQQTAAVVPSPAREAMAQVQAPQTTRAQTTRTKKQVAQRQQQIAPRHMAWPTPRIARYPRYAWFSGPMRW